MGLQHQKGVTLFFNRGRCVGSCQNGQEEQWILENPDTKFTSYAGDDPTMDKTPATDAEIEQFFEEMKEILDRIP